MPVGANTMIRPTSSKRELDTPSLILDLDLLEENLRKMQALADGSGKALRPHAKTHKCSALARRQIETGAIGVCVAKISEAERLVDAGIGAVLITGPQATLKKIQRVVALRAKAPALMLALDHHEAAECLAAELRAAGLTLDVLLDVDVGLQRTGVPPAGVLELAARIRSLPELRLRGIQAYAGHVQHMRSYAERQAASLESLRQIVPLFRELRASGPTCDIFSATGTGTCDIDVAIPEVTELQVGSYVCMDTEYRGIGSAGDGARFTAFGPALRVLTTVVSVNQPRFVTVDAGLKALYRDGGVPQVVAPSAAGLQYDWFGDEYGRVSYDDTHAAPALGAMLELIPSHCDPTVNLFDRFHLVRGEALVGEWPIDLRGYCQ
jgi:D-serine deaminase-like pyridoxal phosphate-dependent protein